MRFLNTHALIALLLFCPAVAHANVTPTPVSDLLASQCRQLENAHGPTLEFPNTFYTNLVFQCATTPGTAPAGVVYKAIEQYAKQLANNDAKRGSVCEITMANGGANVLSQGPMQPSEPSAANDVVVSYNAKYACLSPKHVTRYAPTSYASRTIHSRYEPRPLLAAVPMNDGYGYYEGTHESSVELTQDVSYTPPRPSWVARDHAYNYRGYKTKAVFRSGRPAHHHRLHAKRKTTSHIAVAKTPPAQPKVSKVEVKTTTTTTIKPPAPAPIVIAPSHNGLTAPAPTSPLPGFVSP